MRSSQVSRIALYWAPLTLAISIIWSILLNALGFTGILPAISLAVPAIIAVPCAVAVYFVHDHSVFKYDDRGYQSKRGRREMDRHHWDEFKECSLIKDNYGRKVRVYVERDGSHYDVDPSACGIDPYRFRDFASSRINSHRSEHSSSDLISGLENEIQKGRATWVADLNETFRDYQMSGEIFPLLARGNTRPKGFLLSRLAAFTIMPNYNVCMYVHRVDATDAKGQVMRLLRIIETQRDQKNIKWSWLLLLGDENLPDSVSKIMLGFANKDIGLGYINTLSGEMKTSQNQLGRSMSNQMHLNHLIRDLRRRRYLA